MSNPRTYREAGVDVGEAERAVERITRAAAATATPAVLGGIGGFGGLFHFDTGSYVDPVLVSSRAEAEELVRDSYLQELFGLKRLDS